MPNHIHGIIIRKCATREALNSLETHDRIQKPLSQIIQLYKGNCTRIINSIQDKIFFAWHRNYYDNIIRNEHALHQIRNYIRNNPLNWKEDEYAL
jgi:REP element-mobilizing transposase RayT